jgi:predicted protein tyrosine phosphatase
MYRADPRLAVRSAGVKSGAVRYFTHSDIEWADLIFVMEHEHKNALFQKFRNLGIPDVVVLEIPDDYNFMDPDLQLLIRAAVEPALSAAWAEIADDFLPEQPPL